MAIRRGAFVNKNQRRGPCRTTSLSVVSKRKERREGAQKEVVGAGVICTLAMVGIYPTKKCTGL